MEEDKYDKIEGFLKGRQTAEERKAFEKEQSEDPALAEEVDLIKGLMAATGEEDIIMIDGLVNDALDRLEMTEDQPSDSKDPPSGSGWWWKLLLVLVVMIGLSLLTYYVLSPPAHVPESTSDQELPLDPATDNSVTTEEEATLDEELIEENAEEAPPTLERDVEETTEEELPDDVPYAQEEPPTESSPEGDSPAYKLLAMAEIDRVNLKGFRTRSDDSQAISVIDSAWRLFETAQFTPTLDHLSSGNPAEMDVTELSFLRAMSNLMLQNFTLAAAEFARITDSYSRGYDAEWYRLVALTAELPATREAYEEQLNTILSIPTHPHLEKAQQLSGQVTPE